MTDAELVWARMRSFVIDQNDRRKEVSDAVGISYVRVKALARIARDPLTLGELAEFLVNDRPYTTLIVDDLERRELVVRNPHPDDRRRKIVSITEKGQMMVRKYDQIMVEPPKALSTLSPAQLNTLAELLGAVLE